MTTLRIATGKLPGARPHLVGAFLRIGHGAARNVDGDSLDLPVVDATGALNPFAVRQDWTRLRRHPDTVFRFEGEAVPDFARAVAHCLRLHDRLPQFGFQRNGANSAQVSYRRETVVNKFLRRDHANPA